MGGIKLNLVCMGFAICMRKHRILLDHRDMRSISHFRPIRGLRQQCKVAWSSRGITTSSRGSPSLGTEQNTHTTSEFQEPLTRDTEATQSEILKVKPWVERLDDAGQKFRLPRSVQAIYLRPLRRKAQYGLPVCDLQLRSYSVRNLEFFADFALRAAYYLKLPVSGPVSLPRIIERWTVPRSNFVHKKSQENFERITLRRLVQVKDGTSSSVQIWLAFLRKHAFYGVGMKANVWEFDSIDVSTVMDAYAENVKKGLEPYFSHFGKGKHAEMEQSIPELLNMERFLNNKGPLTRVRKG